MYFPGGDRPGYQALGLEEAPVIARVKPDNWLEIEGWFWPPEDGDMPVIVFFHGNGQAYEYWSEKLAYFRDEGYGTLLAEYRGYAGNSGDPSEAGLYADARAYIEWLRDTKNIQPQDLVLYGESLGTGIAVQMGKEYQVRALVLESPFSSAADVAAATYPFFPVSWLMSDQYLSIEKTATLKMPKLFLHALNDEIINIRFARKLYNKMPEPKRFVTIESGGHNDLYDNGAALHVLEFLGTID